MRISDEAVGLTRVLLLGSRFPGLRAAHDAFAEAGFELEAIEDARVALARLQVILQQSVADAALIIDGEAAGGGAAATCREIRACAWGARVFLLLLNREDSDAARCTALEAGADVCLGPQTRIPTVLATLRAAHRRMSKPRLAGRVAEANEEALHASQALLDRAARLTNIGGWRLCLATGLLTWSDQTCRIHEVEPGYAPTLEEAINFYTPESRTALVPALNECVLRGTHFDVELKLVTAKGRLRWVRAAGQADLEDGNATWLVGALQDITARKAAERELAEQHELMRVTLDSITDAVITTDAQHRVRWLNPVAAQLTGWSNTEVQSKPIDQVLRLVSDETRATTPNPVMQCLSEERTVEINANTSLVTRGGAEYAVELSAAPIRSAQGEVLGAVVVFHDVSEQRRVARDVSYRATRDSLTGLFNRSEFELRLQRALASARDENRVHCLMYIDLDHFKLVNDTAGHPAGDEVLRQVTAMFRSCTRSRDTLARVGGDEFCVIMEDCTVVQAQRVAQKICNRMDEFRFQQQERRFRIGASIGLVPVDRRWANTAAILQAADTACYAAKEAGRNRVHACLDTEELLQTRQGQTHWAARLEDALDHGRFRLYGQRIVACGADSSALHYEVLLRLAEENGSIVAPAVFLQAAERFHLASRIDRWVVKEVLDWMGREDLQSIETVSVNLSGQSIGDETFHSHIAELIDKAPRAASKLCLEVTETAAIMNLETAANFISTVRGLGVRVALDDFGAGASSFGYLKKLPVDFLKIDGQFTKRLLLDPLDRAAICCFRDVAKVVGVQTVAECVETQEVLDELHRIGIDLAQGFLIHRPEPLQNCMRIGASAAQAARLERVG